MRESSFFGRVAGLVGHARFADFIEVFLNNVAVALLAELGFDRAHALAEHVFSGAHGGVFDQFVANAGAHLDDLDHALQLRDHNLEAGLGIGLAEQRQGGDAVHIQVLDRHVDEVVRVANLEDLGALLVVFLGQDLPQSGDQTFDQRPGFAVVANHRAKPLDPRRQVGHAVDVTRDAHPLIEAHDGRDVSRAVVDELHYFARDPDFIEIAGTRSLEFGIELGDEQDVVVVLGSGLDRAHRGRTSDFHRQHGAGQGDNRAEWEYGEQLVGHAILMGHVDLLVRCINSTSSRMASSSTRLGTSIWTVT